jgi:hypothetical protein
LRQRNSREGARSPRPRASAMSGAFSGARSSPPLLGLFDAADPLIIAGTIFIARAHIHHNKWRAHKPDVMSYIKTYRSKSDVEKRALGTSR